MASAAIAKNPPTACIGLEPRPSEMPGLHRSGPFVLVAIWSGPFQYPYRRPRGGATNGVGQGDSGAVDWVDSAPAKLGEQFHALRTTRRPRGVPLRFQPAAGVHRQ